MYVCMYVLLLTNVDLCSSKSSCETSFKIGYTFSLEAVFLSLGPQ